MIRLSQHKILLLLIFVFAFFLRFVTLSKPPAYVFDEVYFAKFAASMTRGEYVFDIHPPLSKAIIGIGIRLFNNYNPEFSYRVMPALFGCLFLAAIYLFTKELFKDKGQALFTTFLFLLEGMYLVYSRLSLIDIFMLTFGILALYFPMRAVRGETKSYILNMILTGIFAGLTISVKWIGIGILPTLFVFWLLYKPHKKIADIGMLFLTLVIFPLLIYIPSFLMVFKDNFWPQFLEWHQQSWNYNINLKEGHPYASVWWTWPLLLRPVWFYFNNQTPNIISGIIAIGNPAMWWAATLAVLGTLFGNLKWHSRAFSALLAGWAIFYLPWSLVTRVLFLYHYLFSSVFALLILSVFLWKMLQSRRFSILASYLVIAFVIMFVFWLPLWTGWPVPEWFYRAHLWTQRWI